MKQSLLTLPPPSSWRVKPSKPGDSFPPQVGVNCPADWEAPPRKAELAALVSWEREDHLRLWRSAEMIDIYDSRWPSRQLYGLTIASERPGTA
jgi:hypothetical protein